MSAVESEHANRFAFRFRRDREDERAAHPGIAEQRPRRYAGVPGDVGDPQRLHRLPHPPRQAGTGGVREVPGLFDELLDRGHRNTPPVAEPKHPVSFAPAEIPSAFPAFRLAHGADHRPDRRSHAVGLGEGAVDRVFQRLQLFGALARGDVLADAAIAAKATLAVEDRKAARTDAVQLALRIGALVDKVGERPPRFQDGLVLLPAAAVAYGDRVIVPARRAENPLRIDPGRLKVAARDHGEAVGLVLLPVPVGGEPDEAFEALLGLAQGLAQVRRLLRIPPGFHGVSPRMAGRA